MSCKNSLVHKVLIIQSWKEIGSTNHAIEYDANEGAVIEEE